MKVLHLLRRTAVRLLPGSVALAVVMVAAAHVVGRSKWVTGRLQQVITIELARASGREVRCGAVEGDLLKGVVVRDVAIGDEGGLARGAVASADEVRIKYRLTALLRGEVSPLGSISRITVVRPNIIVTRGADGLVDLFEMFRRPRPERPTKRERFEAPIFVEDATIEYRDFALPTANGKPFTPRLTSCDARISSPRPGVWRVELGGENPDGLLDDIEGAIVLGSGPSSFFSVRANARGVSARPWAEWFADVPGVRVLGGAGALSGIVYGFQEREPDSTGKRPWTYGYNVVADVAEAKIETDAIEAGPAIVSGRVRYTGGALQVAGARLRLPWARATASGTISGLIGGEPSLDLILSVQDVDLDAAKRLCSLPPEVRAAQTNGVARGDLHVVGPVAAPTIVASLTLPDGASGEETTLGLGPWETKGISVRGIVVALAEPSVQADVHLDEVALHTERGPAWQTLTPFGLSTVAAAAVSGRVTLARGAWASRVTAGELAVPGIPGFTSHEAHVLATDEHLEGRLVADAASGRWDVALAAGTRHAASVFVRGAARGIDLAQARALQWRDAEAMRKSLEPLEGGRADVEFIVEVRPQAEPMGRQLKASLAASLRDLRAWKQTLSPAQVTARAKLTTGPDEEWALQDVAFVAQALDARGVAWAHGTVRTAAAAGGPRDDAYVADVAFAGRRLDLARLAELAHLRDVSGIGATIGHCRATYAPAEREYPLSLQDFQARVVVARPRYEDYGADVLAATVGGDLDSIIIEDAGVRRGRSAASAAGSVTRRSPGGRGPKKLEPSEFTLRLKAATRGSRIEDWLALAGAEEKVTGAVSAEATLTGALDEPSVEGTATLTDARVRGYEIDSADGTFEYADRVLIIPKARIAAYGGQATLTDVRARLDQGRKISGEFSIAKARLDQLPELLDADVEVGGVAQARGSISGSLDEPSLVASVEATRPSVNGVEADSASADIAATKGRVLVTEATLNALGGRIRVTDASYEFEAQKVAASASFHDLSATDCFGLAARLMPAADPDAAEGKRRLERLGDELHGELQGEASVRGSLEEPDGKATIRFSAVTYRGKYVPDVAARFAFGPEGISKAIVEVAEDEDGDGSPDWRVSADGDVEFGGTLGVSVNGENIPIKFLARWLPGYFRVGGRASFTLKASGSASSPVLDGALEVKSPRFGTSELASVYVPRLHVEEGELAISLRDSPDGGQPYSLRADVSLPFTWRGDSRIAWDRPMKVSADLRGLPLAFLPPAIDEFARLAALVRAEREGEPIAEYEAPPTFWGRLRDVNGTIDVRDLLVTGSPSAPSIRGDVSLTRGQVGHEAWPFTIRDVSQRLELRRVGGNDGYNTLRLSALRFRVGDIAFEATGHMDGFDAFSPEALTSAPFTFRLTAKAEKQNLGRGFTLRNLDGVVNVSRSRPSRRNGKSAPLVFDVDHVSAQFKSGKAVLSGRARITDYRPPHLQDNEFDLRLALEDVRTAYRPYFDGRVTTVEPITIKNPARGEPAVVAGTILVYDTSFTQPSPFGRRQAGPRRELRGAPTSWPSPVLNLWVRVGRRVDAQLAPLPTFADFARVGTAGRFGSSLRTYLVDVPIAHGRDFLAIRGTPQEPQIVLQVRGRGGQLFPGDLAIKIEQYSYEMRVYPAAAPQLATGAALNQLRSVPPLARGPRKGGARSAIVDGQVAKFRIAEVQRREGERAPLLVSDYLYARAPIRADGQTVVFIVDGPVLAATGLDVPWRTEPPIDEQLVLRGLGVERLMSGGMQETALVAALSRASIDISSGILFGRLEDALRRWGAVDDVSFRGFVEGNPRVQLGKTVVDKLYLSYSRTLRQRSEAAQDFEFRASYLLRPNLDVTFSTDEERDRRLGVLYRKRF